MCSPPRSFDRLHRQSSCVLPRCVVCLCLGPYSQESQPSALSWTMTARCLGYLPREAREQSMAVFTPTSPDTSPTEHLTGAVERVTFHGSATQVMLATRFRATVQQKQSKTWEETSRHIRHGTRGPHAERTGTRKNGHTRHGKQNHQCKACGGKITADPLDRRITSEQRKRIEHLLCDRISLRGICRLPWA